MRGRELTARAKADLRVLAGCLRLEKCCKRFFIQSCSIQSRDSRMPADSKDSWNSASEGYAPFEAFTGQFTRAACVELPDLLPETSDTVRIMDVAAGTGASTFALGKQMSDHCRQARRTAAIVATDFSDVMLKTLMEKFNATAADSEVAATQAAAKEGVLELTSQVADAQDLSAFADGTFSAITCTFGIMFPPSPEKVVREFWRLLMPGGVAVVTTWHYNNIPYDILPDIAHVFKGHSRFKDLPMAAATHKFGQECYIRRLFRGDLDSGPKLWKDSDLSARFVAGSSVCLPQHLAAMMNKNPLASDLGDWDEAAVEKYLQDHWTGENGQIILRGTALVLVARKTKSE